MCSLYLNILRKSRDLLPQFYCTKTQVQKVGKGGQSSVIFHKCSDVTIQKGISNSLSTAKKSLPKGGNLREMLTHLVLHLLNFYDKNREYYRVSIPQMLFDSKDTDPLMDHILKDQLAFFIYIVELAKDKKRISRDVDTHEIVTTFFLIYIGVLSSFLSNPKMVVEDAIHLFSSSLSLLYNGIKYRSDGQSGFAK